jgi:hypothetical protein
MFKSALLTLNSIKSININRIGSSGSILLKTLISTATASNTKSVNNNVPKSKFLEINLYTSVCVERLPIITCDMNELEQRYSNLINEINIKKSYLSNHELRHLRDV